MRVDVRALHGWSLFARAVDPGAPIGPVGTWRFERVKEHLYLLGITGNRIQRVDSIRHNLTNGRLHAGAQLVTVGPVAPVTYRGQQLPVKEWAWAIDTLEGIPDVVLANSHIDVVFDREIV